MEPRRLPGVAERRRAPKVAGVGRRKALRRPRLQHLPSARCAGPRPGARRSVRQDGDLQSGERSTVDEAYVRESILNPSAKIAAGFQPIMPTFQGLVTEEQLLQLIEYVKSLKARDGARRDRAPMHAIAR